MFTFNWTITPGNDIAGYVQDFTRKRETRFQVCSREAFDINFLYCQICFSKMYFSKIMGRKTVQVSMIDGRVIVQITLFARISLSIST